MIANMLPRVERVEGVSDDREVEVVDVDGQRVLLVARVPELECVLYVCSMCVVVYRHTDSTHLRAHRDRTGARTHGRTDGWAKR